MSAGTSYIIPMKFFFLIFHLLVISIAIYSPMQNIYAGIPANTPVDEQDFYNVAYNEIKAVGGVNIFFLFVEFLILFYGKALFYDFFNVIQIFLHFIGAFLTTWYVIDGWNYKSLKYVFLIFSMLPFIFEFIPLFAHCMKKKKEI